MSPAAVTTSLPGSLPATSSQEKAALAEAPVVEEAHPAAAASERFIATSPYLDHLLDLETLGPQTQLLARALLIFDKTRDDFATAPYADSFNYPAVIDELRRLAGAAAATWTACSYFVVAFRSQIPPTTDYGDLSSLDEAAHKEANESGGLLRYWFENPDVNGRNLATCLWRSTDDARKAGHGEQHRKAASSVRSLYSEWAIERYRLVIGDGIQDWKVIPWVDE